MARLAAKASCGAGGSLKSWPWHRWRWRLAASALKSAANGVNIYQYFIINVMACGVSISAGVSIINVSSANTGYLSGINGSKMWLWYPQLKAIQYQWLAMAMA